MITADARSRITPHDLDLLARSLGGTGDGETIRQGLDEVLDRPELPGFLLDGRMPGPSPSLFFYVLVRRALLDAGLGDRTVADYCAAMLRDFGVRDRAHRVGAVDDSDHHYLVDILADLDQATGERQFRVCVHLGNYALWLTGIFPDRIRARSTRRGAPGLGYYEALGQRGFAQASEHHLAEWTGLDGVLQTTARRFTEVRRALNRVRGRLRLAEGCDRAA
jgi:hypothetical protein